jgi:hypothetical protein
MVKFLKKNDGNCTFRMKYYIIIITPTFADCSEEESFSRSRGITNGSKRGVEENADCRKL